MIVWDVFLHISSLHRGSDKFVSTRAACVARASTVAREVLIWRRSTRFIVYSTSRVRDDRLNLWGGLLARSQNSLWPVLGPQGLLVLNARTCTKRRL